MRWIVCAERGTVVGEPHSEVSDRAALAALATFLERHRRLFVITGAGVSAPSGIATYRDPRGDWCSPAPVQHQDFVRRPDVRRRYWARSQRGWPAIRDARPNAAHRALAALERHGRVQCVLTQNVDGLHQRAGQARVLELHGSLAAVVCLGCAETSSRQRLQAWLESNNPTLASAAVTHRPDGDAALDDEAHYASVRVPECASCGGVLKPDVVFYGDSVPKARVERALEELAAADAVLVVGSSLMVYSSFRFVKAAHARGLPIAGINRGHTRADAWLVPKLDLDCSVALPALVGTL